MIVWHYTTAPRTERILDSGILIPATLGILPEEKPVLWFSSNPFWEQSACEVIEDASSPIGLKWFSMQETCDLYGGLFRFGVPVEETIKWPEVGKRAGLRADVRKSVMKTARQKGADPKQWYGIIGTNIPIKIEFTQMLLDYRKWIDIPTFMEVYDELEKITVEIRDLNEIRKLAMAEAECPTDPEDRVCVNYIRHRLSNYDQYLKERICQRTLGTDLAVRMVRRRTYEAIAEAYPQLAEECQRQKAFRSL
jgi:hypothetical protein